MCWVAVVSGLNQLETPTRPRSHYGSGRRSPAGPGRGDPSATGTVSGVDRRARVCRVHRAGAAHTGLFRPAPPPIAVSSWARAAKTRRSPEPPAAIAAGGAGLRRRHAAPADGLGLAASSGGRRRRATLAQAGRADRSGRVPGGTAGRRGLGQDSHSTSGHPGLGGRRVLRCLEVDGCVVLNQDVEEAVAAAPAVVLPEVRFGGVPGGLDDVVVDDPVAAPRAFPFGRPEPVRPLRARLTVGGGRGYR